MYFYKYLIYIHFRLNEISLIFLEILKTFIFMHTLVFTIRLHNRNKILYATCKLILKSDKSYYLRTIRYSM